MAGQAARGDSGRYQEGAQSRAVDVQREPDLGSSGTQTIYTLDLHVKKLVASTGPNGNTEWSPDGSQLA